MILSLSLSLAEFGGSGLHTKLVMLGLAGTQPDEVFRV